MRWALMTTVIEPYGPIRIPVMRIEQSDLERGSLFWHTYINKTKESRANFKNFKETFDLGGKNVLLFGQWYDESEFLFKQHMLNELLPEI